MLRPVGNPSLKGLHARPTEPEKPLPLPPALPFLPPPCPSAQLHLHDLHHRSPLAPLCAHSSLVDRHGHRLLRHACPRTGLCAQGPGPCHPPRRASPPHRSPTPSRPRPHRRALHPATHRP